MKKYYHVSLKENLKSIMDKGLIPQIGDRSREANEEQAVFLFPTKEDMEFALGQWLGDWFEPEDDEDDEVVLMSLEITLPDDFPIFDSTVEYEKFSKITIPPKYIKYLQDE